MKLFLASSARYTLPLLPALIPHVGKNVLFIANAADPFADDPFWVDWDRTAFRALGYTLHETDLRNTTPESFATLLRTNDIIHICGGSVYYITAMLRDNGFEQHLIDAVSHERIIYTGSSAGAIIPSARIHAFSYDPDDAEDIPKVPDHRGLGLIDFVVVPHSNDPAFQEAHRRMLEHMPHEKDALFFLQDHHALWVHDTQLRFLHT